MLMTNRIANLESPWRMFHELENQINQWFEQAAESIANSSVRAWANEGAAVLEFDLPGLDPETIDMTIDISVHKDLLTVSISQAESEDGTYRLRERRSAEERQFRLPFEADPSRTEAEYVNGILRVTVHQPESQLPTKIAVKRR